MPIGLLTLLKLALLASLYLFLFRVVRVIAADVYGPSRTKTPKSRAAVATASSSSSRRSKRPPRELVLHLTDGKPEVIELGDIPITLGRAEPATHIIDDRYISDEHAQVIPEDGGYSVRDLGSTNGTFLNGAKVTKPTPLSVGDQLRVGKTRIEVRR